MRFFLLPSFFVLLLAGCSRSTGQSLAAQGAIDENAPIKTEIQIVINAPPPKIWRILADIQNWPSWQPDIASVSITQPPAAGTSFDWSTTAGTIHSQLARFDPPYQLAWTGRVLIFHAIHTWTLMPLPNGQTLVQVQESMSGWPIAWFYTSDDLHAVDQKWLAALKKKAES